MKIYKKGSIVLVKYPFTDLSSFKVRPALVLANNHDEDVFLAPITSKISYSKKYQIIQKQDYIGQPLPIESVLVYKIMTLNINIIEKEVSHITDGLMYTVQERFKTLLFR